MRDYSKVSPRRWTGNTGRALRGNLEAQVVVDYLLTCQHANMLGVYYLPIAYLSVDTGIPLEGAWKGLRRAIEVGFCSYDEDAEVVWVHNMARDQIGDALKAKDLRVAGVQREYAALPNNAFLGRFFDVYGAAFLIEKRRDSKPLGSPLEAPSEPLRSQEQEQEQEQDLEQEQEQDRPPMAPVPLVLFPSEPKAPTPVDEVWAAYEAGGLAAGRRPDQLSQRTDKRDALIQARIDEVGMAKVKAAARGIWVDPWAMPGGTCGSASGKCTPEYAFRNVERVESYAASWEDHAPVAPVQREQAPAVPSARLMAFVARSGASEAEDAATGGLEAMLGKIGVAS